jgi:YbbR domain-containing protein
LEPDHVNVTGPQSFVERVARVRGVLNISGSVETIEKLISLEALDAQGLPVEGVTLAPGLINVSQPIDLLGGFKNVVVKVATSGQVANGYRLTNISVSPPTVTLFAENPQLLNEIPGYVDTEAVELDNLTDDVVITAGLSLPEGITSVRAPTVLVQVSVAAIEGSMTISVPVEMVGLSPELMAMISPESVDIIVAGPLNILEKLDPTNFRVILDLSGLPPGVYRRPPVVDQLPAQVRVQTTLPETVEVTILPVPTPTVTITGTLTLTATLPLTTPLTTPQP